MKEGWEVRPLGEVCRITSKLIDPRLPEFALLPHVGGANMVSGTGELRDVRTARQEGLTSGKHPFDSGTVLYNKIRPYLRKVSRPNFDGLCSADVYPLTPISSVMLRDYLYWTLQSEDFTNYAVSGSSRAGMPKVNRDHLFRYLVVVPPLAEQDRIVRILDEAMAAIEQARENTEANLANARTLFHARLREVFHQPVGHGGLQVHSRPGSVPRIRRIDLAERTTRTRGRAATTRHIPGDLSLAVGAPSTGTRQGWTWTALTDLADLESGHTPSRKHPEFWDGDIPWIGIQDARAAHGGWIADTSQHVTKAGIDNSSARVLPTGTVCLSRTASVGYVVITSAPIATSQDFVNWVCGPELEPEFLQFALLAEGRAGLLKFASGSVHQTIYYPEVKALHLCHPSIAMQRALASELRDLQAKTGQLAESMGQKQLEVDSLRAALLAVAFSGAL